jgi:hypothetical protein
VNLNYYINKKLKLYLIIGLVNTIFSYINGTFFYFILYENLGAFFVTLVVSIINIFFSFINYKFIFFKTPRKYFFKEYLKINFFQFNMILINTFLLWISIEKLNISIYIIQLILTIINVIISIIINFKFVFKNKFRFKKFIK